jgi:hypothetical protein
MGASVHFTSPLWGEVAPKARVRELVPRADSCVSLTNSCVPLTPALSPQGRGGAHR